MKYITVSLLSTLRFIAIVIPSLVMAANPNPPNWPQATPETGGVFVFKASDSQEYIQNTVNACFTNNGGWTPPDNGQFSNLRYAFLFEPGSYPNVTIPIGYYTSLMGTGFGTDDTYIREVICREGNPNPNVGALNTFWRSAENFITLPEVKSAPDSVAGQRTMIWAVSQAAPLRRVHLKGNLLLCDFSPDVGFSSGGFLSDSLIEKTTESPLSNGDVLAYTQQQWISRNVTVQGQWSNSVWNTVFVGCTGNIPKDSCGTPNPYVNILKTPIIALKPFIHIDPSSGKTDLVIPGTQRDSSGPLVGDVRTLKDTRVVPFEQVYIATPNCAPSGSDLAQWISSQINDNGYDVILTPGIYHLSESIKIRRDNACVLGIGFPTLISNSGHSCIRVGSKSRNPKGVHVAGIMVQSGTNPYVNNEKDHPLVTFGSKLFFSNSRSSDDSVANGFLHDCFVRVGGTNNSSIPSEEVYADIMLQINMPNVVCDNVWLWRADHDIQGLVFKGHNPCNHALDVSGENVTIYGLFAEHTLKDLVLWNKDGGRVYLFQSELPYDVQQTNPQASDYWDPSNVAYRVASSVTRHGAWGVGAYSFFRDNNVFSTNGFVVPQKSGVQLNQVFTRFLTGKGGINHIINGVGAAVNEQNPGPEYQCSYP